MSKDMLGVAIRKLVTLPSETLGLVCDFLEKLSDPQWVGATKKFLRKEEISWAEKSQTAKPEPPLLIPVGTVAITATTTPFVACDRFVVNTKKNTAVMFSYLSNNFKKWFLGKTETPFTGSTLRYDKLSHNSTDGPIIAELGGEEKAETTLTELFSLLEKQPNGEDGPLLTNGDVNILYIEDVNGVLRAVSACWYGGGWSLHANPVTSPGAWGDERRVFSRDSRGNLAA